jgi:ATP-dependent RNA helicase DOB1
LFKSADEKRIYDLYAHKEELQAQIRATKRKLAEAHSVIQLDELKNRKRVLRKLDFTDDQDVVTTKGRVACEISTGDELLLTQLVYDDVFKDLTPEQCAALLSCFVFTEKVGGYISFCRALIMTLT